MTAVVGNLRHDVSTDVEGLLWVVSYVGICRVACLGAAQENFETIFFR